MPRANSREAVKHDIEQGYRSGFNTAILRAEMVVRERASALLLNVSPTIQGEITIALAQELMNCADEIFKLKKPIPGKD